MVTPPSIIRTDENQKEHVDRLLQTHSTIQEVMAANVIDVQDDKVELHTKRLRLRGALQTDAEYLHEAFKDPEVMRYW